ALPISPPTPRSRLPRRLQEADTRSCRIGFSSSASRRNRAFGSRRHLAPLAVHCFSLLQPVSREPARLPSGRSASRTRGETHELTALSASLSYARHTTALVIQSACQKAGARARLSPGSEQRGRTQASFGSANEKFGRLRLRTITDAGRRKGPFLALIERGRSPHRL